MKIKDLTRQHQVNCKVLYECIGDALDEKYRDILIVIEYDDEAPFSPKSEDTWHHRETVMACAHSHPVYGVPKRNEHINISVFVRLYTGQKM